MCSAVAWSQVAASLPTVVPTGTIFAFAGGRAPDGYLWCNGSTVSKATFSVLYAAIGDAFGRATTLDGFVLPDLRGRVAVGSGNGTSLTPRRVGESVGTETHTISQQEMPSHAHGISDPGHGHSTSGSFASSYVGRSGDSHCRSHHVGDCDWPWRLNYQSVGLQGARTGISIGAAGGNGAHPNMQPSLVVSYIIKA